MIPDEELKIEVLRDPKYNYGGQHVGVPVSIIKVTHKPTEISVSVGYGRSQFINRNVAISMLEYGLLELGWKFTDPDLLAEKGEGDYLINGKDD